MALESVRGIVDCAKANLEMADCMNCLIKGGEQVCEDCPAESLARKIGDEQQPE
jgi:hypothetical protein